MRRFVKDPGEVLNYTFNWDRRWLSPNDFITGHTITVPAGITKQASAITGNGRTVTVWLSGGTLGATYEIICTATTSDGATGVRRCEIGIEKR